MTTWLMRPLVSRYRDARGLNSHVRYVPAFDIGEFTVSYCITDIDIATVTMWERHLNSKPRVTVNTFYDALLSARVP